MTKEIDSYIKGPAPSRTPDSQYTYLEQQLTAVERAFNRQKQAIVEASENAQALYDNEVIVRATADSALVQTIETLDAKVDLNNTTTQATITNIQTAFADSESATASKFTSLESKVDSADSQNRALIIEEMKTRATKVDALASKLSSLEASVKTNASDSRALVTQEAKARADADSAEASVRQALSATVTNNFNTLNAAIIEESTARANADSAEASVRQALSATVTNNFNTLNAAITNEATVRADADSAEATARQALSSRVTTTENGIGNLDGRVTTAEAALVTEAATRASADSAEATARQNLQAFVGYTTGQQYTKTLASQLSEESTARVEADKTLAQKLTTLSSGTSRVLTQDNPPSTTGRIVGDVWYDTNDNFRPYVWAPSAPGLTDNQWRDNSGGEFTRYIGQLATVTNKLNTLSTNDIVMAGTTTTLAAKLNTVDQGIGTQYTVASKGLASTSPESAGLFVNNGTTSVNIASRSYNLWIIDRATGVVTSFTSYDVFSSTSAATALATVLNALTNASIVVIATFDEPQANRLSGGLPAAMYRCGASRTIFGSSEFKLRSAYILVGIPGEGEGSGVEKYSGSSDSSSSAYCSYSFTIKNGRVEGLSGLGLASATLTQLSTVVADPVNGLAYQWAVNGSVGTDSKGASALILSGGRKANGSGGWTDYSRIVMSADNIEMNGNVIVSGTLTADKIEAKTLTTETIADNAITGVSAGSNPSGNDLSSCSIVGVPNSQILFVASVDGSVSVSASSLNMVMSIVIGGVTVSYNTFPMQTLGSVTPVRIDANNLYVSISAGGYQAYGPLPMWNFTGTGMLIPRTGQVQYTNSGSSQIDFYCGVFQGSTRIAVPTSVRVWQFKR